MANPYCCFNGVGTVSIVKASDYLLGLAGLVEVGNCTKFDVQIKDRKIGNTPNKQLKTSSEECSKTLIGEMTGVMDLSCYKDSNLILGLFGKNTTSVAAAAVTETFYAYRDSVINLGKSPATPANILVKGFGATVGTTYVLGTDYTINEYGNGIVIPATSSIPAVVVTAGVAAQNLTITYSSIATSVIDIATAPPEDFYIEIAGANLLAKTDAESAYLTRLFKCTVSPAKLLSLITDNDNSGRLEFTFTILANKTMRAKFNSNSDYGQFIKAL
jgi:hypothetical protein